MTTLRFKNFDIEAYKPGKSSVKKLKKITKLSANESALGVSPRVRKIISNRKLNLPIGGCHSCNFDVCCFGPYVRVGFGPTNVGSRDLVARESGHFHDFLDFV